MARIHLTIPDHLLAELRRRAQAEHRPGVSNMATAILAQALGAAAPAPAARPAKSDADAFLGAKG